jgi:hypothetical protein
LLEGKKEFELLLLLLLKELLLSKKLLFKLLDEELELKLTGVLYDLFGVKKFC